MRAEVLVDKSRDTIFPIIIKRVIAGSTSYANERKYYSGLNSIGYSHYSVCNKYSFVFSMSGIHTQSVGSFNNELKREIKKRKGVFTNGRKKFLYEFVKCWNNKSNLFNSLLELIKFN